MWQSKQDQDQKHLIVNLDDGRASKTNKKFIAVLVVSLVAVISTVGLILLLSSQSGVSNSLKPFLQLNQFNLSEEGGEWVQISNEIKGFNNQIILGYFHQIKLQYSKPGEYYKKINSTYIQNINLEVKRESSSEMTFKMFDTEQNLFNLPNKFPFPYSKDFYDENNVQEDKYGYEMMVNGTQLRVFYKNGDKEINVFNTKDFKIIFSKLYTEIQTYIDTPYIWGLGDRRTTNFLLSSGNYTIWNKDQSNIDVGTPNGQIYGTHPMWLQRDTNGNNIFISVGNYHIIMIKTSSSMQFEYQQNSHLNFKIIGGIVEIKFFFGGSDPRTVIDKYHRYVNGWTLHPFWSSGWHQSKWGYNSSSLLLEVVSNYSKYQLPLDVMWSDLDHMEDRKDFSLDTNNFLVKDMQKMTNKKNKDGVEWVNIVDPGIAIDSDCARRGITNDIFIKTTREFDILANGTNSLLGCVWPGKVFYPDFNHPNSTETWHQCFVDFNNIYNFTPSGVWIDMNEYSNFIDGELDPSTECYEQYNENLITGRPNYTGIIKQTSINKRSQSEIEFEDLPFNPQGDYPLDGRTVSLSGVHYNENDSLYLEQKNSNLTELYVHNLNGFLEGIATKESQTKIHQTNLTFVLSRSTFAGSGRFVQHWLGDNASTWKWLSSSMGAIFNFNLFGTPMVGDDVCGFNEETNDQLCARWLQLGSFYPFARNHDTIDAHPQEPWQFDSYVVETARKSLNLRYSLLKFYYTEFVTKYDKNIQAGIGSIFNPLFYIYEDVQALLIDHQFAIGDSIIVVPVVKQQLDPEVKETTQEFYVPQGAKWFNWSDGNVLEGPLSTTVTINFADTSLVCINQGKIVPTSDTTNVYRSRYLPTSIGLAIGLQQEQNGQYYKYSAKGQYLSLISFEPLNVEFRCWNNHSTCYRQIIVTGSSDNITLKLTFTNVAGSINDSSEEIVINQLQVYGVMINGQNSMKITIPVQFSSLQSIWSVEIPL